MTTHLLPHYDMSHFQNSTKFLPLFFFKKKKEKERKLEKKKERKKKERKETKEKKRKKKQTNKSGCTNNFSNTLQIYVTIRPVINMEKMTFVYVLKGEKIQG